MDLHNKERAKKKPKRRRSRLSFVGEKVSKLFLNFSGHKFSNVSSIDGFSRLLHQEVDSASLGIGRMLFGEFYDRRSSDIIIAFSLFIDRRKRKKNLINFNILSTFLPFLCRNNDAVGYTRRAQWGLGPEMGRAERLPLSTFPLHKTTSARQDGSCLLFDVAR